MAVPITAESLENTGNNINAAAGAALMAPGAADTVVEKLSPIETRVNAGTQELLGAVKDTKTFNELMTRFEGANETVRSNQAVAKVVEGYNNTRQGISDGAQAFQNHSAVIKANEIAANARDAVTNGVDTVRNHRFVVHAQNTAKNARTSVQMGALEIKDALVNTETGQKIKTRIDEAKKLANSPVPAVESTAASPTNAPTSESLHNAESHAQARGGWTGPALAQEPVAAATQASPASRVPESGISSTAVRDAALMQDTSRTAKGVSAAAPIASKLAGGLKILGKVAVPLAVVATAFQAGSEYKKGNGKKAANAVGSGIGGFVGFIPGMSVGASAGAVAGGLLGTFAIPIPIVGSMTGVALGGLIGGIGGGLITSMVAGKVGGKITETIAGGTMQRHIDKARANHASQIPLAAAQPLGTKGTHPQFDNDVNANNAQRVLAERQLAQQQAAAR